MGWKSYFDYNLATDKIAQRPAAASGLRSSSRLLHAVTATDNSVEIRDRRFEELDNLLQGGDLLILNNSRVIPGRFFVKNPDSTGSDIELLLLKRLDSGAQENQQWEALGRPMKKLRAGDELLLSESLKCKVIGRTEDQSKLILELFKTEAAGELTLAEIIERDGLMPIPPYIRGGRADNLDRDFYQTVYADIPGSAAAPTAGLHFSDQLLERLSQKGVEIRFITLHVGPASFLPVRNEDLDSHPMPAEQFIISAVLIDEIKKAQASKQRIVAVGTTVVRALEAAAQLGVFSEQDCGGKELVQRSEFRGETNIFIRSGFSFKVVDCLITNFHQPRSTHLLLVAALIGEEQIEKIYQHAIAADYRFLSYGDAMFLDRKRV